ncbi:MAG: dUTP diphosphatase [Longibaculum muris]|uniref:Dimeric dUTPase (All-alpha-NTP-PPase superfamily) n=1 Tax=Longibaculum muris TaxID=1796628 RepID=A0A4R3YF31_9FIRM|nr:dUTP diphosphatase [Longibaculum muris]KXU51725.1 dUTP diphosphatase [Candidatus Stoquefichus sp. KLE1796]MBS5369030.1 dUTP diphosphatase [Coprobacillus cateniformis]MCR1887615.1 dUTP diphosphatase [Longibaculum muris]MED9812104.1 dUTP diphosphatase [Longibaculum muris]TCV91135.1 dimeric dUTPase (all-alpha-NTP-PPase superfamily) [Longibaculum muris]
MNNVSKLYEVYVNRELQTTKNEILNVQRLNQKILSFLHDLAEVSQDSRCYLFWEKEEAINHQQLLEHYIEGLTMLMSIGYELRIDSIKNHTEIPQHQDIFSLFFKIYHSILKVQSHYSSDDYQNTIDDYFTLGFQLGIDINEIIENYQND